MIHWGLFYCEIDRINYVTDAIHKRHPNVIHHQSDIMCTNVIFDCLKTQWIYCSLALNHQYEAASVPDNDKP